MTSGHWFCTHSLEKIFEVATMQKELTHFGPGLGPGGFAFLEPFANLSRISRLKNEISETKCLCKGVFYNLCQSCRVPLAIVRTWDNTKHESCGNSARKTAKYEYYIFINSGIQTFRRPYAALSRPFATAAKHTHPYLQRPKNRRTCTKNRTYMNIFANIRGKNCKHRIFYQHPRYKRIPCTQNTATNKLRRKFV